MFREKRIAWAKYFFVIIVAPKKAFFFPISDLPIKKILNFKTQTASIFIYYST